MNKIRITDDVIELIDGDGKIDIKATDADKFLNVKTINIKINEDTNLAFEILNNEYKYDIYFNVLKGVHSNIYEIKKGDNYKFQYKYYLEEDSFLNVEKVNDGMVINEMNLINKLVMWLIIAVIISFLISFLENNTNKFKKFFVEPDLYSNIERLEELIFYKIMKSKKWNTTYK